MDIQTNEQVKKKLAAFCRAGASVTAADTERSTFWRSLEQKAANLTDEEAAFITGETKELPSAKLVSPIGEGDTPLHLLLKIMERDGDV